MNEENFKIHMIPQPPIPDTHTSHHHTIAFNRHTTYHHKITPNTPPNPKRSHRGIIRCFQKSRTACYHMNQPRKASPFFAYFLESQFKGTIFGGSDLEIKPLEYIDRRFYIFQFIS